jgi:hypothetical protein
MLLWVFSRYRPRRAADNIQHIMSDWQHVLRAPADGDHIVQVYQDRAFLTAAVAEYVGTGLQRGEAAIIIARPEHADAFRYALGSLGIDLEAALGSGQLRLFDAQATLARFLYAGMPQWVPFREIIGGAIAESRCQFPVVRAYGEMVDILWQDNQRDAAIRLEEFWNELGKLQSFSLFCAYYLDNLDARSYSGLDCICKVHSHLIPAREYQRFDESVSQASEKVLEPTLARMLFSMSAMDRPSAQMPLGQATLLWLQKHMPVTAEKVLAEVRAAG